MRKLVVPKFKSERQEAKWWDDHMDAAGKNLLAVMQNGTAHRGGPATLLRESRNITIRIANADIERARKLAEKKGIGYQTYMKMLLREALDREERRARKAG
ncbi:MAG TPA: CopG family antitoxin [Bryobacteraceae bacterium]|nr:CopG family antitoxin [Bryobacteraceae bacterium]